MSRSTSAFCRGPCPAKPRRTHRRAVRARLFELLSSDCDVEKEVLNFNQADADLAVGIAPLLLDVLKDGAPDTIRKTVQAEASAQYDRRQAWLAEDGEALFGEDARRLSERKRTDHVTDVLRRTDILFRENAVRALGIVGGPDAVARFPQRWSESRTSPRWQISR